MDLGNQISYSGASKSGNGNYIGSSAKSGLSAIPDKADPSDKFETSRQGLAFRAPALPRSSSLLGISCLIGLLAAPEELDRRLLEVSFPHNSMTLNDNFRGPSPAVNCATKFDSSRKHHSVLDDTG
jgi:hypothetical protein